MATLVVDGSRNSGGIEDIKIKKGVGVFHSFEKRLLNKSQIRAQSNHARIIRNFQRSWDNSLKTVESV